MTLVKATLKEKLKALSKKMVTFEDQEQAIEYHSTELANIITEYIQSATVTVEPGILVQVAYPAGTGATNGPGTGTLS